MKIRTGIDMVYISRLAKYSDDENSPFLDKCFTPMEKQYCMSLSSQVRAQSFAARFAAKEAAAKALGTGICTDGIGFLNFEVSRDEAGAPVIKFNGKAREKAQEMGVISASLSLSHENEYAIAVCTLLTNEEDSI